MSGNGSTSSGEAKRTIDLEDSDQETINLLNQIEFRKDPTTGTAVPRDFSRLSVSEAVELLALLRKAAEFGKEPPSSANTLARKVFAVINEKLREVDPKIPRLMEEEASLTVARDAAQKVYEQYLSEKARFGKPLVYCGAAIALYLVSIAVGSLVVAVAGGLIALWAFGRSTLCRTFRAAMYVRLADMLDGSRRNQRS
jgi:hypothetical protein